MSVGLFVAVWLVGSIVGFIGLCKFFGWRDWGPKEKAFLVLTSVFLGPMGIGLAIIVFWEELGK